MQNVNNLRFIVNLLDFYHKSRRHHHRIELYKFGIFFLCFSVCGLLLLQLLQLLCMGGGRNLWQRKSFVHRCVCSVSLLVCGVCAIQCRMSGFYNKYKFNLAKWIRNYNSFVVLHGYTSTQCTTFRKTLEMCAGAHRRRASDGGVGAGGLPTQPKYP